MCQYLYFCTSKAGKLSTSAPCGCEAMPITTCGAARVRSVSICTFVPVKQVRLYQYLQHCCSSAAALLQHCCSTCSSAAVLLQHCCSLQSKYVCTSTCSAASAPATASERERERERERENERERETCSAASASATASASRREELEFVSPVGFPLFLCPKFAT